MIQTQRAFSNIYTSDTSLRIAGQARNRPTGTTLCSVASWYLGLTESFFRKSGIA